MNRVLIIALLISPLMTMRSDGQESLPPVSISGFIDMYYSKNFDEPANRTNKFRNFDIAENQFTLSLAELSLQKKAAPAGFRLDLNFGTTNDIVQSGTGSATLPIVQQGYATFVLPFGAGLTVDAGKFVTHMGYEAIESKENWNYSRSLLFAWAVPYYHTGIRLTYPVAGTLTGTVHIVNGWNSVTDNNDFKSFGVTLNYFPDNSTTVMLNAIDGIEQPDPGIAGKKKVFDLIAVRHITESFSVALNADYGDERTMNGLALWRGIAVYGRYNPSVSSSVSLRGEIFEDRTGYATGTGIGRLTIKEITATYEQRVTGLLLLRGEMRYDFTNTPIFDHGTRVNGKFNQTTILAAVIASF